MPDRRLLITWFAVVAVLTVLSTPATSQGSKGKGHTAKSSAAGVASASNGTSGLVIDRAELSRGFSGNTCSLAPYIGASFQSGPLPQQGNTSGIIDSYNLHQDGSCAGGGFQISGTGQGPDLVFRIHTDRTCDLQVTMDPEAADLALYVVTDCGALASSCVGVDDAGVSGQPEDVTFTAEAGTDYYVIIDGYADGEGSFDLTVAETTSLGCHLMPTFYGAADEPAFEVLAPALPTEDFEEAQAADEVIVDCNSQFLDSQSNDDCFDPGDVVEDLELGLFGVGTLQAAGPTTATFGNSTTGLAASDPGEFLVIDPVGADIHALAFDLASSGSAGTESDVSLWGPGFSFISSYAVPADNGTVRGGAERFVGVVSPVPIDFVYVNSSHREFIDDVRFGPTSVYFENFSSGLGTTTANSTCGQSIWAQESTCPAGATAPSAPEHAVWHSGPAACAAAPPLYATGTSAQRLRTDPIDISACSKGAVLDFWYMVDFNEPFDYDRARVEVGVDGVFTQVATNAQAGAAGIVEGCTGAHDAIGNLVRDSSWHRLQIPVGIGSELIVDFHAEASDAVIPNEGQGFLVDDVRVFCSDRIFEDGFESGNTAVW